MGMRLGTLGLVLATASGAVWADDEVHELGQVSVTAGGYVQQVEDAPASISVINREQIEERFYQDTTDALRDVPGVIVTGVAPVIAVPISLSVACHPRTR